MEEVVEDYPLQRRKSQDQLLVVELFSDVQKKVDCAAEKEKKY